MSIKKIKQIESESESDDKNEHKNKVEKPPYLTDEEWAKDINNPDFFDPQKPRNLTGPQMELLKYE